MRRSVLCPSPQEAGAANHIEDLVAGCKTVPLASSQELKTMSQPKNVHGALQTAIGGWALKERTSRVQNAIRVCNKQRTQNEIWKDSDTGKRKLKVSCLLRPSSR